jgi:hypothetical protein
MSAEALDHFFQGHGIFGEAGVAPQTLEGRHSAATPP